MPLHFCLHRRHQQQLKTYEDREEFAASPCTSARKGAGKIGKWDLALVTGSTPPTGKKKNCKSTADPQQLAGGGDDIMQKILSVDLK